MAMKLNDAQRALIEEFDASKEQEKVLEVKDLVISFKTDNGLVQAVRGVSFDLYKQETLCIVGESGSGKSVTSKTIMGILSNNAVIQGGQVLYQGEDLLKVSEEEFHRIRGHKIGMIFQDPLSSLNPIVKIGKQIIETMMINRNALKNRYNDLIAPELTAYKNAQVERDYAISHAQSELDTVYFHKNNKKEKLEKAIAEDKARKFDLSNIDKLSAKQKEFEAEMAALKAEEDRIVAAIEEEKKQEAHGNKLGNVVAYEKQRSKIIDKEERLQMKLDAISATTKSGKTIEEQLIQIETDLANKKAELAGLNEEFAPEIAEKKAELARIKKEARATYKTSAPALKTALAAKKKEAKADCKAFKAEAKKEKEAGLKAIEEKRANIKLSPEDEAELKQLKKQISLIRLKYGFLEKLCYFLPKLHQKFLAKGDEALAEPVARRDEIAKPYDDLDKEVLEVKETYQKKVRITTALAKKRALQVMKEVGIPQPEKRFYQYPFQFSGGMRQRIVIAIALTAAPDILICDEPTTALDVTIQAQILELINRLKEERHLSCIFITHDLGVVANMADRVAVMYAGKIVEYGREKEVFFDPRHPYTWALLSSIPDIDSKEKLEAIPGTPPDMIYPPEGDAFAERNKYALGIDFKAEPPFFKISDSHYAATWLEYPGAPDIEPPLIVKTRILNALNDEMEKRQHEKENQ